MAESASAPSIVPASEELDGPADDTMVACFRSLMSAFPTGVAIVTSAEPNGQPWGMTCSSLCSVTLVPPTILVCLRSGPTLAAVLRRATFAVNLVHDGAQPTAELFASGRADRFDRVRWHDGPGLGGPQLLDDAHAAAHCQLIHAEWFGDHAVVFGEVFSIWEQSVAARPLLYGLRQYAAWPRRP